MLQLVLAYSTRFANWTQRNQKWYQKLICQELAAVARDWDIKSHLSFCLSGLTSIGGLSSENVRGAREKSFEPPVNQAGNVLFPEKIPECLEPFGDSSFCVFTSDSFSISVAYFEAKSTSNSRQIWQMVRRRFVSLAAPKTFAKSQRPEASSQQLEATSCLVCEDQEKAIHVRRVSVWVWVSFWGPWGANIVLDGGRTRFWARRECKQSNGTSKQVVSLCQANIATYKGGTSREFPISEFAFGLSPNSAVDSIWFDSIGLDPILVRISLRLIHFSGQLLLTWAIGWDQIWLFSDLSVKSLLFPRPTGAVKIFAT